MLLLVSGNRPTVDKLEKELQRLGDANDRWISIKRTATSSNDDALLPYVIDVVSLDQNGIVFNLASFFSSCGSDIAELNTDRFWPEAAGHISPKTDARTAGIGKSGRPTSFLYRHRIRVSLSNVRQAPNQVVTRDFISASPVTIT